MHLDTPSHSWQEKLLCSQTSSTDPTNSPGCKPDKMHASRL